MTPKFDKLQIKKQLEDAHQEVAKSLRLRDQMCIEQAADAMDQIQAAAARELAISNLDRSICWLREIEDALRRLDVGEYGACANCEEGIGRKRLRAVPWAQLCLKCQEMSDQSEFDGRGHDAAGRFLHAA